MTPIDYPVASVILFMFTGILFYSFVLVVFYIAVRLVLWPIKLFWGSVTYLMK